LGKSSTYTRIGLGALAVVVVLLEAPRANAEEVDVSRDRWEGGIGFGFRMFQPTDFGSPAFGLGAMLPFQLGAHLRLEPMFDLLLGSSEAGDPGAHYERSTSDWLLGLGALYTWALDASTMGHAGVRGGFSHRTSEVTSDADAPIVGTPGKTSQDGYFLAGVVGGELFASSSFSFGGELELVYNWYPEAEMSSNTAGTGLVGRSSGSAFGLSGVIFVRIYFWRFA
jgi:hypothetical protein